MNPETAHEMAERISHLQCIEHSGVVKSIKVLEDCQTALFKKIDRLNATAFALLITIIVDVLLRIAVHLPH
jgi:hypothetical protein